MKRKKIYLLVIFILLAMGALVLYREYNRGQANIKEAAATIIPSDVLLNDFVKDEIAANKKYADKVIQVSGTIKEVTQNQEGFTVAVLSTQQPDYSLRCTFDSRIATLKNGAPVTLKGVCKGILLDELIIDHCYLVN